MQLDNQFYSFVRCAIISFYTKCLTNSDSKYYSSYIDNISIDDYLDMFVKIYKKYKE